MVILGSTSAWAKTPILQYECQFQAGRTRIEIMDDGSVAHSEMPGRPPVVTVTETPLTSQEIIELKQLLKKAVVRPDQNYIEYPQTELGLGERIGTFVGYLEGTAVLLIQVTRVTTSQGYAIINPNPVIKELQKWVISRLHATNQFYYKFKGKRDLISPKDKKVIDCGRQLKFND